MRIQFITTAIPDAKELLSDQKHSEIHETPAPCVRVTPGKENDAFSANENSQANAGTVSRPVRKRNRPSRFTDNPLPTNQGNREHKSKVLAEKSHEGEDILQNAAGADGSLKRRRGRPKANSTDHASDESQNPPKRPVRRRQVALDSNV